MRIIKIVAITLMLVIAAPSVVSAISSFYTFDCELLCCEKPTEEEQKENKSEKDFDDLEEYLLSKDKELSELNNENFLYSFRGKHFIDIVTDIVNPPPEA